jgi:quercetin dioxygenase-like cupin family protein
MGDTSTFFLADGARTGDAFALVDERARQGESVPLHRHDDVESFYVLEGEVTFFLGGEPGVTGGPGTFAHVPPGVVHGFRIASAEARYLILTTPRHGAFYRAITLPSRTGGLPPSEPIGGDRIRAAAVEYEIEFVGPLPD